MSLFMKDPKKTAAIILDAALKKKPQTSDGAVKDVKPANSDQASRVLEAIKSNDGEALMNSLRSFFKSCMNESTDEKPEVPKEEY